MLRVDQGDLLLAISSHDIDHFLDVRTGDVIPLHEDMPEFANFGDDIGADPDRYRKIEPVPSPLGFRWMEEFARRQVERQIQAALLSALERRRPFRSFKDALAEYPAVLQSWYGFEEERQLEYAHQWLMEEGIDAELVSPNQGVPPREAPPA